MKIKVAELEGAELDYWVARAAGHILKDSLRDGWQEVRTNDGAQYFLGFLPSDPDDKNLYEYEAFYSPSISWQDGGPIIERELDGCNMGGANGVWKYDDLFKCQLKTDGWVMEGETPLLAICRCYVAEKFGEEVEE